MKKCLLAIVLWFFAGAEVNACAEACGYFIQRDGQEAAGLETHNHCAAPAGHGRYTLFDVHRRALSFNEDGLASILIGQRHFYVKSDGAMLQVLTHDNWADTYSEGLVRSAVDGKVAYFDTDFRPVIPPRYDWGWPFRGGRALVCKGCSAQPPDEHGHKPVTGGTWGYIDRQGNEVVPVAHTREELSRHASGS